MQERSKPIIWDSHQIMPSEKLSFLGRVAVQTNMQNYVTSKGRTCPEKDSETGEKNREITDHSSITD